MMNLLLVVHPLVRTVKPVGDVIFAGSCVNHFTLEAAVFQTAAVQNVLTHQI
jgi:hypothetical protein